MVYLSLSLLFFFFYSLRCYYVSAKTRILHFFIKKKKKLKIPLFFYYILFVCNVLVVGSVLRQFLYHKNGWSCAARAPSRYYTNTMIRWVVIHVFFPVFFLCFFFFKFIILMQVNPYQIKEGEEYLKNPVLKRGIVPLFEWLSPVTK